jgi:hypothetical protein
LDSFDDRDVLAIKSLRVSGAGLSKFPSIIRSMTTLTHLDLSNNEISVIPGWLHEVPTLQVFRAHHNRICSMPGWISDMELTEIDLSSNFISSFPTAPLGQQLRTLKLANNGMRGSTESILRCMNTIELDLGGNQFTLGDLKPLADVMFRFVALNVEGNRCSAAELQKLTPVPLPDPSQFTMNDVYITDVASEAASELVGEEGLVVISP